MLRPLTREKKTDVSILNRPQPRLNLLTIPPHQRVDRFTDAICNYSPAAREGSTPDLKRPSNIR
jgi:hypothetical protein